MFEPARIVFVEHGYVPLRKRAFVPQDGFSLWPSTQARAEQRAAKQARLMAFIWQAHEYQRPWYERSIRTMKRMVGWL